MAFGQSILGGSPQGSILGGQPMAPRVPWGQNPMVTMAGLSLLGAPTLQAGFQNLAKNAPYGMNAKAQMQDQMLAQQEKAATKAEVEAEKQADAEMWNTVMIARAKGETPTPELLARFYQKAPSIADKWYGPKEGTFQGTGLDAQDSNILLTGDPGSPEYAMAFSRQYETPKMVTGTNEQGQMIVTPVMPPIPPGIRRPSGGAPGPVNSPGGTPQQAPAPTDAATVTSGGARVGEPIVTGTAKPSDAQLNAALYADRMAKSNAIITSLERAGTSYVDQAASQVPAGIGNYLISDDYRQLDQAQRDFINATLRRESGAVISPEEFDNAKKQYFPQPGDDPQTIEQKRANRQTAINGISRAAGGTYSPPAVSPAAGGVFDWSPDGGLRPAQ